MNSILILHNVFAIFLLEILMKEKVILSRINSISLQIYKLPVTMETVILKLFDG